MLEIWYIEMLPEDSFIDRISYYIEIVCRYRPYEKDFTLSFNIFDHSMQYLRTNLFKGQWLLTLHRTPVFFTKLPVVVVWYHKHAVLKCQHKKCNRFSRLKFTDYIDEKRYSIQFSTMSVKIYDHIFMSFHIRDSSLLHRELKIWIIHASCSRHILTLRHSMKILRLVSRVPFSTEDIHFIIMPATCYS